VSLRIAAVSPTTLEDWRMIHNKIIPTAPLSAGDVEERLTRHLLTLAYDNDALVGNATLRPPTGTTMAATVIVRVLPEHRRQGHGSSYFTTVLADARALGAQRIETVILASNGEGLSFAMAQGFVEFDRYTLDGDTISFIDMYLADRP
jgi:GNAT superfamily N-acetyltransferase